MNENQELDRMEKEWKNRFDRFTAPQPSMEKSFDLINKIKTASETLPYDFREELEFLQEKQSTKSRVINLFLSQWNYYGSRNWLYTGVIMLLICLTINEGTEDGVSGYVAWLKWGTLVVILFIAFAFRTKDEGNRIIEELSYTPVLHQLFARFIIVMGVQFVISLPLSYFIFGNSGSVLLVFTSLSAMFIFGVIGFVSTFWFGQKIGLAMTLVVWLLQFVFESKVTIASIFQEPQSQSFMFTHMFALIISLLLLSSVLIKGRYWRNYA